MVVVEKGNYCRVGVVSKIWRLNDMDPAGVRMFVGRNPGRVVVIGGVGSSIGKSKQTPNTGPLGSGVWDPQRLWNVKVR